MVRIGRGVRRGQHLDRVLTTGVDVAAAICQRHVSESQTARVAPASVAARTFENSGAPTAMAMSYFSFFRPYVPGDPAAVVVEVDGGEAGDECEQVHRRQPDPVAPELARRMVGQRLVDRPEPRVEPALVVEVEQQLADVPGRLGDGARVGVVEVEHLAVLGLERVRARGRRADDPVAAPRVVGEDRRGSSRPGRARRRTGRC